MPQKLYGRTSADLEIKLDQTENMQNIRYALFDEGLNQKQRISKISLKYASSSKKIVFANKVGRDVG
jgi:hypothetical protein